jgi:hypothetical protein
VLAVAATPEHLGGTVANRKIEASDEGVRAVPNRNLSPGRYLRALSTRAPRLLPALPFVVLDHYRQFGNLTLLRDPETFTELVQAKKLYDKNPVYTQTADKVAARDFVAERIGEEHLIPVYQVASSFRELRLEDLPDAFALKASHGCAMNLLVHSKHDLDLAAAERLTRKWLRQNYFHVYKEWAYKGVPPRLIAEELLVEDGKSPPDFKLWVFNGKVRLVSVDVGRFGRHLRTFFDVDWRPLVVEWARGKAEEDIPRPERLEEMIRIAETLGRDFPFVRIDLYQHKGRVYFGEITHYPGAGRNPFDPPAFNRALGDLWRFNQDIPEQFYGPEANGD